MASVAAAADESMAQRFASAATAADFLALWLNHRLLSDAGQKLLDDYYMNFRRLRSARLRHWYNQQVAEADALVRARPGLRVLEVGVGTGTEFLWWAMLGADVTGIDAFRHCIDVAAERRDVLRRLLGRDFTSTLQTVRVTEFEDESGFDLIWMEQAFHHLEPRAEVLQRIARLLRPGGYLVASEANALNPLLQLQLLRARGLKMILTVETGQGTLPYGNERVLTRGALVHLLGTVGIEQVSSRYFRVFPAWPAFEPLFGLERRVSSRWLAPLFTHYNLVGRKAARG
jgi:2-polyprenyl-3-methyl-5-hydroxy-6-metoxy-1,4-benzoquinol methylase